MFNRLLVCLIISNFISYAFGENLYFISGCPSPNSIGNDPTIMYRLSDKKLISLKTIFDAEQGTRYIRPYYKEKMIILKSYGSSTGNQEVSHYSIMNMQNPEIEMIYDFYYDPLFSIVKDYFASFTDGNLFLGIEIYSSRVKVKNHELYWINLSTMKTDEAKRDFFNHIKASGLFGGLTRAADIYFLQMKDYGNIYKPINGPYTIELNWNIPQNLVNREKDNLNVIINNDEMLVIRFLQEQREDSKLSYPEGFRTLVFDKKNQRWYKNNFPEYIRAFDRWIVGYVTYTNMDKKEIPGKEVRYQDDGITFDGIANVLHLYAPGIVFLYDVQTQKKIELDTGQGDSEILLVDGNNVYLRIYDAIYKAEIADNKITNSILLYKEDESAENIFVPDIHWAFLGPESKNP